MEKEIENQAIEEMAVDLCLIDRCKHLPQEECNNTTCAHCEAEALYNAGYRKQSEGEWENVYNHDTPDGHLQRKTACSVCGYKPKGDISAKTPYCPNCGAHMKGGAE
jgi:hypothetical protein